jgi:uncharacterized membrane protein
MLFPGSGPALSALGEDAPRGIAVAPEYAGVIVPQGEDVSMDLVVENRGPVSETVLVSLPEVPEGWEARIKTYAYEVTGVRVPGEESRKLTLEAVPGKDIPPGDYLFPVEAGTEDGALRASSSLRVTVVAGEKKPRPEGVSLSTSYPVLQGPTGAEFEFSLDVENELDRDVTFSLNARAPRRWEVRFKPAYEEKFISSLRIKAGQSRSMGVEVKPDPAAGPGEYPVRVEVGGERARGEAELTVVLTGTHEIRVGTADGLLSLKADQGQPATLSFFVENSGSAVQRQVRFLSFHPENWEVTFDPESIESLPPGDIRQVQVKVTPAGQALVGDYAVSLSVRGEKVSEDLELRVTVRASTAWGWVGVGVILLVIAGLVLLFIRVGRR